MYLFHFMSTPFQNSYFLIVISFVPCDLLLFVLQLVSVNVQLSVQLKVKVEFS